MVNLFTKKDPLPQAAVEEANINEDETEEPMRLLISNGCEICVVDIKQSKGAAVKYVRKISTLKLAEEQLPGFVGLFRRGSDAYMVGGKSLPTNNARGTSSDTYRLSISNNGTLSASKCNDILRLQSPILWPVVAEIEGKVHVFNSFPKDFQCDGPECRFSHEVISDSSHVSRTIETPEHHYIESYLVLGDHIFAVARSHTCLLFNQIKLEWNFVDEKAPSVVYQNVWENVWDIIRNASAALCVEEFQVGKDCYYMVLALQIDRRACNRLDGGEYDDPVIVMACLVTSKGDIVGRQTLHKFFKGHVKPLFVSDGAIVKGGGTDGKTMCIAFTGVKPALRESVNKDSSFSAILLLWSC